MSESIHIMVGNDDGIRNIGIDALATQAESWGNVHVVCPATQQTARAKALTFHRPIRVSKALTRSGIPAIAFNSSPADSIIIHRFFYGKPDIVLSGINSGENTSVHSILTSGTAAVSLEAGLQDIPSFAFSMDTPDQYFFKDDFPGNIKAAAKIGIELAKLFYTHASSEFWERSLFVNINFPSIVKDDTKVELVGLETYKYKNYLVEREDPAGGKYYWLWGKRREDFDKTKDSYKVTREGVIAISPVTFNNSKVQFDEARKILSKWRR